MALYLAIIICELLSTVCIATASSQCVDDKAENVQNDLELNCFNDRVNVSVVRTSVNDGAVKVNYFITHTAPRSFPIIVDIVRGEEFLAAFHCENDSLAEGGRAIVEVTFTGLCGNPTVVLNHSSTFTIILGLEVLSSGQELACSTVIIGPQRLELFSEEVLGQLTPFLRLLNVDSCNRVGPAVPIKLTTSTNAFITLYPDGSNQTSGGISVRPLDCNDSHIQAFRVSVYSAEDYTLYGAIVNALLPTSCIQVNVSVNTQSASPNGNSITAIVVGITVVAVVFTVIVIFAVAVPVILWLLRPKMCNRQRVCEVREREVHQASDSENFTADYLDTTDHTPVEYGCLGQRVNTNNSSEDPRDQQVEQDVLDGQ